MIHQTSWEMILFVNHIHCTQYPGLVYQMPHILHTIVSNKQISELKIKITFCSIMTPPSFPKKYLYIVVLYYNRLNVLDICLLILFYFVFYYANCSELHDKFGLQALCLLVQL